jgi:hypothetical protein
MSFESLISNLIYPALVGLIGLVWKQGQSKMEKLEARLEKLEDTTSQHVTEAELRRILSDKIDPIKEDISEVKKQNDKITDILLNR